MTDDVRLATRVEVVTASYGLDAAKTVRRVVEHDDFVVAFLGDAVDVFRFRGAEIAEEWSCR